jgi:hypothetical protein
VLYASVRFTRRVARGGSVHTVGKSSKRLAFHPARFEPALILARSDWQKRYVDEDAIAHGSEMISSVEGQCA